MGLAADQLGSFVRRSLFGVSLRHLRNDNKPGLHWRLFASIRGCAVELNCYGLAVTMQSGTTNEHEWARMQKSGIRLRLTSDGSLSGEPDHIWKRLSKALFSFVLIRVHSWSN